MRVKNVVLVHGGFVDGAGWEGVYKILKKDGYNVSIVQNPTISLEDDVAATKRVLAAQDGGDETFNCIRSVAPSNFGCNAMKHSAKDQLVQGKNGVPVSKP